MQADNGDIHPPHWRFRNSRSSKREKRRHLRHELLFNNKAVYNTILTTKQFRLELRGLFVVLPLRVLKYANFTLHNHIFQTIWNMLY